VAGLSSYFVWLNRSKESLTLDLKQPAAQGVLARLIERADVFVQNLAPGAADPERTGDDPCPAVVAIQTRLGDQHANGVGGGHLDWLSVGCAGATKIAEGRRWRTSERREVRDRPEIRWRLAGVLGQCHARSEAGATAGPHDRADLGCRVRVARSVAVLQDLDSGFQKVLPIAAPGDEKVDLGAKRLRR
jgi:hypothetical protein